MEKRPQVTPSQPQAKKPRKNHRWLYIWGAILLTGLTVLVLLPRQDDATVTEVATVQKSSKGSNGQLSQQLSQAVTSRQEALPLPTKFATLLPPPDDTATPTPTPLPPTATVSPTSQMVTHVVAEGEMPLSIAFGYGLDVETILEANNIADPTLLQIGQALIIPITVTPTPLPPTATPTPKYSPTPSATPRVHVVEAGDTPLTIAYEYDVTTELLMRFNKIFNPSGLQIGQELIIPTGNELPESYDDGEVQTTLHVVNAGDTLLALTYRYGSTVEDIMAVNPDVDPTNLQIGEQITIPITREPSNSLSYAPTTYNPIPAVTIPAPATEGIVGLQQQMLQAVNAYREAHGMALYQADGTLNEIAMSRAQDMDARGYFSHVTPEGLRVQDIVRSYDIHDRWVSENIQRNTEPVTVTVEEAITWFMGDPPHRYNILHPHYTRIGIGISDRNHYHTFVLVFAGN